MELAAVLSQTCEALVVMRDQTAALVRSIPDMTVAPPDSEWTVREAATHMVTESDVHADLALGKPTPRTGVSKDAIARDNERFLSAVPDTGPAELGQLIATAVGRFVDAASRRDAADTVVWAGDAEISVAHLAGVELGELVLHGYDVASTVGAPWPIDPVHAGLILFSYGPLYRTIVNHELAQGLNAGVRVELRGGDAFTVRFVDGIFSLEPPDAGPVDCVISAEPVAFLMVVSGRLSQWAAISLGLLQASGDQPGLALGLTDLFIYP